MTRKIFFVAISILLIFGLSVTQTKSKKQTQKKKVETVKADSVKTSNPKITFIELGSVNCIPCKAMKKVMEAIEKKYGEQIKIIFYDVWTEEQAPFAQIYKIRLIPTQVFLDADGKEIHRHEGFYAETEIDMFLQSKGLKPKAVNKE